MNEQTVYSRERNGYRLEVIKCDENGQVTFSAKLTNITSGATKVNGNWWGREVAMGVLIGMYNEVGA